MFESRRARVTADFLKDESLSGKFAEQDALDHAVLARAIAGHVDALPVGSVIAVQGSWGSGKTDVVARVYAAAAATAETKGGVYPLWLNPWKYGKPDLITPVVLRILERVPAERRGASEVLRSAARTLLRAGNAMMFKAVSVVAPFGQVLAAGEDAVDSFLDGLFEHGGDARAQPDLDPLAAMAERFSELVSEYARAVADPDGRLLICVDDLDRCLPDHQIAMLEAIHFLTSAEAQCSFVVALDPSLVRQAAATHYRTDGFDSSRYLDKLFNLRIHLPALAYTRVESFVGGYLVQETSGAAPIVALSRAFGVSAEEVVSECGHVFVLPELANPRLISRVLDRLTLLAAALAAAEDETLTQARWLRPALVWSAITERWPQVRELWQALNHGRWRPNFELICHHYGLYTAGTPFQNNLEELNKGLVMSSNVIARMPGKEGSPDLGQFLVEMILEGRFQDDEDFDIVAALQHCDLVFGRYGV